MAVRDDSDGAAPGFDSDVVARNRLHRADDGNDGPVGNRALLAGSDVENRGAGDESKRAREQFVAADRPSLQFTSPWFS